MDPSGAVQETSKQVGSFIQVMKDQPLSLALVVMNISLLTFLFYQGYQEAAHKKGVLHAVATWQDSSNKILSSCVSADIMMQVLKAYEHRYPPKAPQPEPEDETKN